MADVMSQQKGPPAGDTITPTLMPDHYHSDIAPELDPFIPKRQLFTSTRVTRFSVVVNSLKAGEQN
jgi:hypothetical protein